MKKLISKLSLSTILLALVLSSFGGAKIANAQSTSTTIIPPTFELFANPGDSLNEKIAIRNESSSDQTYNITGLDFEAQGDQGEVTLVKGDTSHSFSLASWMQFPDSSITVKAHSKNELSFVLNVPQNAEPGGHYGAVSIATSAGNTPGVANVSSGQVSLVLLRVSGNVSENAKIVSFSAPSYSEFGPITFSLKVHNNGDVHVKPNGTIVITDTFGAKVAEIPLDSRNVLPGADRLMTTLWNNKNPIGRYTATLVSTYGEKHQSLLASTTFVVFPKPLAIGIVVGAASIVLLISLAFAGRKRIAKAMKVIAQG